eukprot:CAMPEP_0173390480 /NCGR_PEP_ID=MMETSP1356-20130122/15006_1 /TAXON_ID=77927 ORGANISM="Hemiselmis virescens, Strain PCC157" /NCGR_SAMPLE_ID=MMETSP1356 /ASSEMBLY_ACC=CAM_ASM_000847 /LENGTH=328 /DNA_ID=CAMNT_0014347881 /DNA_START=44 /DNA_END=1030 /DNA_ORIENTATION=-
MGTFLGLLAALSLFATETSAFGLAPGMLPAALSSPSLTSYPPSLARTGHSAVAPLRMASSSAEAATGRRGFLQLAGAAVPAILTLGGGVSPAVAADSGTPVAGIALKTLQTIAGGSEAELEAFKAPTDLQGADAAIYKVYKYAAEKCPATEDPRASLRGLFQSRVADGVYKWGVDGGIAPKVYDARGDGMTNQGKGGAIKGVSTLLAGYKKKGLLKDFTVDSSKHVEDLWLQAQPTTMTITVTGAAGSGAGKALKAENGLLCSLAASGMQGYFKQVKLFSQFDQSFDGDVETIVVNLKWAGKERQKGTLDRRAADKLNAARAYTEKVE